MDFFSFHHKQKIKDSRITYKEKTWNQSIIIGLEKKNLETKFLYNLFVDKHVTLSLLFLKSILKEYSKLYL